MNEAAPVEGEETPLSEIEETNLETNAEPAPAPDDNPVADPKNKVQERINKITRDKYKERERANKAEAELKKLQEANVQPELKAPKLEDPDIDHDYDKLNIATAQYEGKKAAREEISEFQATQKTSEQQRKRDEVNAQFNTRVADFMTTTPDYSDSIAGLPDLPADTLDTLMQVENAPQVAYYLSKHLDVADNIANVSPMAAAMELGRISQQLSTNKPINKPSAAPDPIDPINQSGAKPIAQEDPLLDGAIFK